MLLDRAGPTAFVLPALLDVANRARQQTIAAVPEDELGARLDVVIGHHGAGRERASERVDERVASEPLGQPLVGQREQEQLPVGEVGHVDVYGAVRQDPARHLEREGPVEAAGEELPADRVAHVVGEQRDLVEPEVAGDRLDQIRLLEQRVALVGLVAEAEAEQVGQHHAAAAREAVEDPVPVVRRGRKAVQHEHGAIVAPVGRRTIDDEHAVPEHLVMPATVGPPRDAFVTRHHGSIVSSGAVPAITDQNRKWWVVIAMSGVMILLTVDFFGITVALPRIGDDLDASTTTLLWTVNAYLLAFVSPMIAIGRFADIFGRRKMALIGIVLFVAASAACAGAPTVLFLIAARVVQGVGGGIIFTVSVSIVNDAFEPDERAKALGIWAGVGLAGSALGPFLAGVLTEFASWRWFFFLNVPIGIVTFVITVAAVEESRDPTFTGGVDWTGFATLTVGFVLTIVGLQQASNEGWGTLVVLGPIVIGVAFLAVFVVNELKLKRRVPLVQFSLFSDLRFAGASVVAFIGNWMFGVILFFLTLYLQNVLDLSPLAAGGVFLAFSVPLVAMSPIGGRLVSRFGAQALMAVGMALVAVGMFFFTLIDADSGIGFVLIGLVIAGFGQGFAYNISNTAGMESMPDEKAGIASGVLQTARLMGIVIGLALSSTLFTSLENSELLSQAQARGASAADIDDVRGLLSGSTSAEQHIKTLTGASRSLVEKITDIAFTHALRYVMLVGVLLCLVSIWPALWGRRKPVPAGEHPKTAHPLWPSLWRRHHRRVPAGSTPPA